jgi:dTMP kinase
MNPESTNKGIFVMIDGIDGSGKSTIVRAWQEYLEGQGKRVFSIRDFWATHGTHPTPRDAMEYDIILSAEPTYVWIGSAIRQEMIQHGSSYSAHAVAQAYALDRLVLYKRFLLPMRDAGKIIIQDRGVSTSLCYQPIQGDITREAVAQIEGNAFALAHAPDVLFLTHIAPSDALVRLNTRTEKQDNALFEQQAFLDAAHASFHSEPYQELFRVHGSHVVIIDTHTNETQMKQRAITALQAHLS